MATSQIIETTVQFVKTMEWNSISMISDSEEVDIDLTKETMHRLQDLNISIAALEIFTGDPVEAVERIAKSDSRVIIVNCYFDYCAMIACRAYQRGLYGPRIMWVFPGPMDKVNDVANFPKECTKEKLHVIDNGSFQQFQVTSDYETAKIDLGLTGGEFDAFLEATISNFSTHPMKSARFMCFDSIAPVVKMLHNAEMSLKAQGSTLKDEIKNPAQKKELQELIRQSVIEVDTRIFSGRVKYQPGAHAVLVPAGFTQTQGESKPAVFVDDGASSGELGRIRFVNPVVWSTPDGKAPTMFPAIDEQFENVDKAAGKVISAIAFLVAASFIIIIPFKMKLCAKLIFANKLCWVAVQCGIVFFLLVIFIYINSDMGLFCKLAPIFALIGLTMVSSFLFIGLYVPKPDLNSSKIQVSHATPSRLRKTLREMQQHEKKTVKEINFIKKASCIAFLIGFVSIWSLIIWYSVGGMPKTSIVMKKDYDDIKDIVHVRKYTICVGTNQSGNQVALFVLIWQFLGALLNFIIGITKNKANVDKTYRETLLTCLVYFPVLVLCTLVIFTIDNPNVIFYILSTVVIIVSLLLLYIRFFNNLTKKSCFKFK